MMAATVQWRSTEPSTPPLPRVYCQECGKEAGGFRTGHLDDGAWRVLWHRRADEPRVTCAGSYGLALAVLPRPSVRGH